MKKIIRVFLASSIVEFVNERMAIENFIRNVSDKFEEHYDVKIQPLLCENFDDAYSKVRKQEEYNEKICESELCFFIFFTKAGEYTREEFEVARKRFEETGKPKIYTYFKVIKDEKAEQSLYDFMEELDKTLGHYYGTFEHIDTVKLRILLSLKLQEMDFVEIKVEDGNCVVDGRAVMPLTNISEFANNEIYRQLQAELAEVEEKYFRLKAEYVKGGCSDALYREYAEIATKRQNLLDAIEELQKNIFNMSLRLSRDSVRGEITPRQKEAYRLFEAGDIEGANAILDFAEIKNEYQRRKMLRAAEQKKDAQIFIRETKTKIDILKTMHSYSERFAEIEELYEEIVPEALDYAVETDTVLDYVWFLKDQNKQTKALEIAKQLEALYESGETEVDDAKRADLYLAIATVCSDLSSKKGEAERYFAMAIALYEKLAAENPERFIADLATSYNNAGVFYGEHKDMPRSMECCLRATEIFLKYKERYLRELNCYLGRTYSNVGAIYSEWGMLEGAEDLYLKAITTISEFAEKDPEIFNFDLALIYSSAGHFYANYKNQPKKAETLYLQAITIFTEIAKENSERINPDLAHTYNNAGVFYNDQGQPDKAEKFYLKAIAIREKLATENSGRFNPDLALSCYNYAEFRKDNSYFAKALELAKTRPDHPVCKQIIAALTE